MFKKRSKFLFVRVFKCLGYAWAVIMKQHSQVEQVQILFQDYSVVLILKQR